MLLQIDERRSKIARSSDKWQWKTLFPAIFLSTFVDSINVIDCRLSGVINDWPTGRLLDLCNYRDQQCGPRSDYSYSSYRSSLIWIYTFCQKPLQTFQRRQKQTTFVVIDALRVNYSHQETFSHVSIGDLHFCSQNIKFFKNNSALF